MTSAAEGYTLTIGDLDQVVSMAFPDAATEERLNARLRSGDQRFVGVQIAPVDETDVSGHALAGATRSIQVRVNLDDDDTEGHAIAVHFPTTADADRFRRRLMAAGLLTGTIAIGSLGAVAVANMPAASDVTFPANTAVYERPAGHGMMEGVDQLTAPAAGTAAATAAQASGIDPVTGMPARSGLLEGVDGGLTGGGATLGSSTAERPAGHGPLEGVDR